MSIILEHYPQGSAENQVTPAELIGLAPEDARWLMEHHVHELGNLAVTGPDQDEAFRFHSGPLPQDPSLDPLIYKGGIKFKPYRIREEALVDGLRHSDAMLIKSGIIDQTGYIGGKGIVIVDPASLVGDQGERLMRGYAQRMFEAGLANPLVDVPAGDEGTNQLIRFYRDELQQLGVTFPDGTITGKPTMLSRPAATGLGAAVVQHTDMALHDRQIMPTAVQGAGFAGAYFAAHASQPRVIDGQERRAAIMAIGDKDTRDPNPVFADRQPLTLYTEDPSGLPITPAMVDAILLNRATDPDMIANGHDPIRALAAKIERAGGKKIYITHEDVLYHPAEALSPAATSGVIHDSNLPKIRAKKLYPIANVAVKPKTQPHLAEFGIETESGPLTSSGGIFVSLEEHQLDLRRMSGEHDATEDVKAIYDRLGNTMEAATRAEHRVAEKYGVPLEKAAEAIGLARHAMRNNVAIDPAFRELIAA